VSLAGKIIDVCVENKNYCILLTVNRSCRMLQAIWGRISRDCHSEQHQWLNLQFYLQAYSYSTKLPYK